MCMSYAGMLMNTKMSNTNSSTKKNYVEVELDTLHYSEKRLHKFVKEVLEKNYTITDRFQSSVSYILIIETEEDGDRIAYSLCRGFWEVKCAHDRRHDRWTLN